MLYNIYAMELLAFAISTEPVGRQAKCGYSDPNTFYRLTVASLTFIFGALLLLDYFDGMPTKIYWTLYLVGVLWYGATVADTIALWSAAEVCEDSWGKSGFKCYSAIYGKYCTISI
jgi:hypothetical protein